MPVSPEHDGIAVYILADQTGQGGKQTKSNVVFYGVGCESGLSAGEQTGIGASGSRCVLVEGGLEVSEHGRSSGSQRWAVLVITAG